MFSEIKEEEKLKQGVEIEEYSLGKSKYDEYLDANNEEIA